jgi:hypothetical protein
MKKNNFIKHHSYWLVKKTYTPFTYQFMWLNPNGKPTFWLMPCRMKKSKKDNLKSVYSRFHPTLPF